MRTRGDLLTTGQAAEVLGCSRQHVVDLCNDGRLECQTTHTHRRIRRRDLDGYVHSRSRPRREEVRSLWLNRTIAGKLTRDPDGVLKLARQNLDRFREIHAGGAAQHWLDEWADVIEQGPEAVMRVLTEGTPQAQDLRQNSPFPGVLSERERQDVLSAFSRYWAGSA